MTMDAKYASTGVLLVLPANGNGSFHADLGLNNLLCLIHFFLFEKLCWMEFFCTLNVYLIIFQTCFIDLSLLLNKYWKCAFQKNLVKRFMIIHNFF